jgi:hypothetical protein
MSIILFHFFLFPVTDFFTPGLFFPIKLKEEKNKQEIRYQKVES